MRIVSLGGFAVAAALMLCSVVQAQWGGFFGGGQSGGDSGGHDHGDHGGHGNNGWGGGGGDQHYYQHGDHYHHNDSYHDNDGHYNNNNSNNYRRNYNNYSEPTYSKPKPKATVKSNPVPKAKPKPVIANAMKNGVARLTKEEFEAAQGALQAETDTSRGLLQGDIGQGVTNQAVVDLLKEADQATQNGGALPPDWRNRYEQAVAGAGVQTGVNFKKNLDSFVGSANANAMFAQGGFDSNTPDFPSGMVNCILMPVLPADEVCMVRPGCCLIGTGGSGSIGVVACGASELVDMPIGDGEPNPDSAIDYANGADEGVLIINPPGNDIEINFLVDNDSYDLAPDDSRNFTGKDSWVIRFNRGKSKKDARYTIEPGTYVFAPGENGWDLFRRKIKVSVTNNGQDEFNYVADNEQVNVEPGETLTHSSDYPIFVRFDRGDGEESSKRIIDASAKLGVAVNPQAGVWDLFPSEQVQSATYASAEAKANVGKSGRTALFNSMAKKVDDAGGSRSARLLALMRNGSTPAPTPPGPTPPGPTPPVNEADVFIP